VVYGVTLGSTGRDDHRVIFRTNRPTIELDEIAVVPENMDALEWLRKQLDAEGSDLLREMVALLPSG